MSSVPDQALHARLSTPSTTPRPKVTEILHHLKTKEFESPVYVCLLCATETHSQHAMAAHCRQHIRAGLGKGTVEHIKYWPDHTFVFLRNSHPNPNPRRARRSSASLQQPQATAADPAPVLSDVLPIAWFDTRTNRIMPFNATTFRLQADLVKYPSLKPNPTNQEWISAFEARAAHSEAMHQAVGNPVGAPLTSVYYPHDAFSGNNANGLATSTAPVASPSQVDLTLRLGPAPRVLSPSRTESWYNI